MAADGSQQAGARRRPVVVAALLAVAILGLAAVAIVASAGGADWSPPRLVALGQGVVRARLQARRPVFLTDPQGRAAVHPTGRADLRAVCGWLKVADPVWAGPRFFYVLFQRRLAGLSTETVFIQTRPGEPSPDGGEAWCRSPALQ